MKYLPTCGIYNKIYILSSIQRVYDSHLRIIESYCSIYYTPCEYDIHTCWVFKIGIECNTF